MVYKAEAVYIEFTGPDYPGKVSLLFEEIEW